MTPIVADVALALGTSLAASIVAKATVTMVLALLGVRLARRSSAAVRHVLWAAAFAVLLALPLASILVPSVRLVQLPIVTDRIAESPALPSHTGVTPAADSVSTVFRERATIPSSRVSASVMLLAAWAAGALLFLLPVFVGLWHMRKLRRLGQPWRHGELMVRQLAADAGVHRRVEVLLHGRCQAQGVAVLCDQ
jgi:hypothetical protein